MGMSFPCFPQGPVAEAFFARQAAIWGLEGQEELARARLLIVGLGGLGAAAAEILVRLGVGGLYLMDSGRIDPPDLNRQILYTAEDIGRKKVEAARERLSRIRPGVDLHSIPEVLTPATRFPKDICGVIDGLDSFADRFLLDELCQRSGYFLIHAGLSGLYGQVTTLLPGTTPRLPEIFAGAGEPEKPPPAAAPICLTLASIQAVEAVKQILGIEGTLAGRLLLVDLSDYRMEVVPLDSATTTVIKARIP